MTQLAEAYIAHHTDHHMWTEDKILIERDRSDTEWACDEVRRTTSGCSGRIDNR